MSALGSYKLRLERQRRRIRAFRKRRELSVVVNRTAAIRPDDLLVFSTLRNERVRLPYFLQYYRDMGIGHFLFVDNNSNDGSREYLTEQKDASVWTTDKSYKRSKFGVDWLNWLQARHGHGHWTLVVDVDEFLVFPFCDSRPLRALTDWLDASSIRSFAAMLVDMYPKGPIEHFAYEAGENPLDITAWFDSGNYMIHRNWEYGNLWIQGGPRARRFFARNPDRAPALNKIPLVKWHRSYTYTSSTHTLLPRSLNHVFEEWGGEKASGCLLHAKFLNTFAEKSREELKRRQHYAASREYVAYNEMLEGETDLWCEWSEKYINWRQLEILGLMSKGNWA